jgi:hypothetical protein
MRRSAIFASLLVLFLLGLVPAFAIAKAKPPAGQAAGSPAKAALGSCKSKGAKKRFSSAMEGPAKKCKKGRSNGTSSTTTTTQTSTSTSTTTSTRSTTSTTTSTSTTCSGEGDQVDDQGGDKRFARADDGGGGGGDDGDESKGNTCRDDDGD